MRSHRSCRKRGGPVESRIGQSGKREHGRRTKRGGPNVETPVKDKAVKPNGEISQLSINSDSTLCAWTLGANEVYIRPLSSLGDELHKVKVVETEEPALIKWSPSDPQLLYVCSGSTAYVRNVNADELVAELSLNSKIKSLSLSDIGLAFAEKSLFFFSTSDYRILGDWNSESVRVAQWGAGFCFVGYEIGQVDVLKINFENFQVSIVYSFVGLQSPVTNICWAGDRLLIASDVLLNVLSLKSWLCERVIVINSQITGLSFNEKTDSVAVSTGLPSIAIYNLITGELIDEGPKLENLARPDCCWKPQSNTILYEHSSKLAEYSVEKLAS